MSFIYKNKKHEELARHASEHFKITMETMNDICFGKFRPRLFSEYFTAHNNHYLFIQHPSHSGLFLSEPNKPIIFYSSIEVSV
jgi:hypothetical protein